MIKFFNKIIKLIKKCFTKNKETTSDQVQANPSANSITRLEARITIKEENQYHNNNPKSEVEINFLRNPQADKTDNQSNNLNSEINYDQTLNRGIVVEIDEMENHEQADCAESLNSSIATETDDITDDEQSQIDFLYLSSNHSNLEKKSIVPSLDIKKAIEIQKELIEKEEPATKMNPESNRSLSAGNLELKMNAEINNTKSHL
jgi:hypothetical protein